MMGVVNVFFSYFRVPLIFYCEYLLVMQLDKVS